VRWSIVLIFGCVSLWNAGHSQLRGHPADASYAWVDLTQAVYEAVSKRHLGLESRWVPARSLCSNASTLCQAWPSASAVEDPELRAHGMISLDGLSSGLPQPARPLRLATRFAENVIPVDNQKKDVPH
jgi:hypothetical protein